MGYFAKIKQRRSPTGKIKPAQVSLCWLRFIGSVQYQKVREFTVLEVEVVGEAFKVAPELEYEPPV
jgi:hypothetical protein